MNPIVISNLPVDTTFSGLNGYESDPCYRFAQLLKKAQFEYLDLVDELKGEGLTKEEATEKATAKTGFKYERFGPFNSAWEYAGFRLESVCADPENSETHATKLYKL